MTWREVLAEARQRGGVALRRLGEMLRRAGVVAVAAWRIAKPPLRTALQILLAVLLVFEEWGWRPLADLLGRFARWRPWAALEHAIARLPPYAALVVFVVPSALLLPLKFLALFLVANGHMLLAGILFRPPRPWTTALIARVYLLTEPALMQIAWFAWAHDTAMPWKDALTARVRASWAWRVGRVWKERVRRVAGAELHRWRPTLLEVRAAAVIAARRARNWAAQQAQAVRTCVGGTALGSPTL